MTAYWLKVLGTIAICLIYEFYYGGGDMESYFWGAKSFLVSFFNHPDIFFRMLFANSNDLKKIDYYDPDNQLFYSYIYSRHFFSTAEFTVIKISGLISLVTFHSFIANSLFFSMFSLYGSWKLFNLLSEVYPALEKQFAIACFYIPSIIFWGSGLLKDPITFGGLCLVVYSSYRLFVQLKFYPKYMIALGVSSFLVLQIKPYIFLSVLPGLMLLILFSHLKKVNLPFLKALMMPFLISVFIAFTYLMANSLKKQMGKYAIENLTTTMQQFQEWHFAEKELYGASVYSLGSSDYSTFGILKKFPLAVNVTYFRPYIWESRKPIILLSALESMWFILLTLRTFYRVGVFNFFRIIGEEPLLIFTFIFSMIFAFAVGLSSYNFGALARYKIPCMSYYMATIYVIDYIGYSKKKESEKAELRNIEV